MAEKAILKRILRLTNIKNKNYSLTQEFLYFLKDSFAIDNFIETGTYLGESAYNASKVFNNIYTIELSSKLYMEASQRYSSTNINFYCGDSAKVLAEILPHVNGKSLLWLDGHYSGGVTAKAGKNTPIIEEIETLKNNEINNAAILVDDIRLFQKADKSKNIHESLSGYPDLKELTEAILSLNFSYHFAILGDVLLAYLPNENFEASDIVKACTISRLYEDGNAYAEALKAEQLIMTAQNEEKEFLINLPEAYSSTEQYGLGFHYRLWKALTLLGDKDYNGAQNELLGAQKINHEDWRIDYYLAAAAKGCNDDSLYEKSISVLKNKAPFLFTDSNKIKNSSYSNNDALNNAIDAKKKTNQPVKFHLGCGENKFEGYINIDYPPENHNVMNIKPDVYADILGLELQSGIIDEIRLHHVFEHFSRVNALAMLIKWHQWLKIGGTLVIETPDLNGSARTILSNASLKVKMGVTRHLAGDQAAPWAYHIDHWFKERYESHLPHLGFEITDVKETSWQREPYLSNIQITAKKIKSYTIDEALENSEPLLWLSTVSDKEKPTHAVWVRQLREVFYPNKTNLIEDKKNSAPARNLPEISRKRSLEEIYEFNQRDRDKWVLAKSGTVAKGARVLDVGAGTSPYRKFFTHCDFKTHDFKKYEGVKLGGTTEYAQIDYVSDILNIPVEDNFFDVVLCTETFEHIPEPIPALKELARIIKPGGRILLTAPLGSGLHQLPYHFYGGYTPEWYKHFAVKFGLEVNEITSNGGFFKLLAQECARVKWTFGKHEHLHGENKEQIAYLFGEWLPRYLYELDEKCFIDQFTVGYHVEMTKKPFENSSKAAASFPKIDSSDSALIDLAEIEFKSGNLAKAKRLAITALSIDPSSERAKELLNKL